ncbi:ankyrin repeat domain-containing protein [Wolbachia endosymbiont (group A) of Epistrophe grossularia]|uniref:ankyrin repeat domain-containing protein n=1 Tax=Wolbachia endosymbiont (group A) of Epistrophe grossularia TaxID=2954008 RepID=UPI002A0A14C6|nr:ankyrin repeat domain-containing protein [Wolbachia endosymbiont (group A) of Epistrophe grossularia]
MKAKAIDNYKTILQIASKNCSLAVTEFSVKNLLDINTQIPMMRALHYSSGSGCLQVVKFLVEEGADISVTGGYMGWTALHHAADKGHLEVVKLLLDKGADPTATAKDGRRPRNMAVVESRHDKNNKDYDKIIKLLANAEEQYKSEK